MSGLYKLCIQRMQNTEISCHPKAAKLPLYVPNRAQPQTQCLFSCSSCTTTTVWSATHILNIPLTKTNMYRKNFIKNHCVRHWNNLEKNLSDIADSELSLSKIKSYLKQKDFGQYWTLSSSGFDLYKVQPFKSSLSYGLLYFILVVYEHMWYIYIYIYVYIYIYIYI